MLAEVALHKDPDPQVGQSAAREAARAAAAWAEQANDAERLARAIEFSGRLQFWAGEIGEAAVSFERAMAAAREAGDSFTEENSLAYLIGCWHLGPMPVDDALPRVEEILRRPELSRNLRRRTLHGRARFTAMLGRFDEARVDLAEAQELERGLGLIRTFHPGEVELLAGDFVAAEAHLRVIYDELLVANDLGHLATLSHLLADAVLGQDRIDEALALTAGVESLTVPEDIDAQSGWRRVRAKALARNGQLDEAVALARDSVAIADQTEYFDVLVQSVGALGEVLLLATSDEAGPVLRRALEMHEQKGNLVEAARIRQVLGPPAT